jgi:hypothetical protein
MSAILDVGQPYTQASIELCNIFNVALSEINHQVSLKFVPSDAFNNTEIRGWLFSESIGFAGEVTYTDQAIVKLEFVKLSHFNVPAIQHWFSETINLTRPNSLQKLGVCLKRFTSGAD